MINLYEVTETNKMIEESNLDVRTITLGISLLDCADGDLNKTCEKIYNKITTVAEDLVETGREIMREDLRLYIRMNMQSTSASF